MVNVVNSVLILMGFVMIVVMICMLILMIFITTTIFDAISNWKKYEEPQEPDQRLCVVRLRAKGDRVLIDLKSFEVRGLVRRGILKRRGTDTYCKSRCGKRVQKHRIKLFLIFFIKI